MGCQKRFVRARGVPNVARPLGPLKPSKRPRWHAGMIICGPPTQRPGRVYRIQTNGIPCWHVRYGTMDSAWISLWPQHRAHHLSAISAIACSPACPPSRMDPSPSSPLAPAIPVHQINAHNASMLCVCSVPQSVVSTGLTGGICRSSRGTKHSRHRLT